MVDSENTFYLLEIILLNQTIFGVVVLMSINPCTLLFY